MHGAATQVPCKVMFGGALPHEVKASHVPYLHTAKMHGRPAQAGMQQASRFRHHALLTTLDKRLLLHLQLCKTGPGLQQLRGFLILLLACQR